MLLWELSCELVATFKAKANSARKDHGKAPKERSCMKRGGHRQVWFATTQ